MRAAIFFWGLILVFQGLSGGALPAGDEVETRSLQVQPGDTLSIKNDVGKIRIRPWKETGLDVTARKTALQPEQASQIRVSCEKSPGSVAITTIFPGTAGEAVDFEINAPDYLNLSISGRKPEIDIAGMQGVVRIQSSGGRVTVENLISAVSVTSDSADLVYRSNIQPRGDVRLESAAGNIYCELDDGLNLRSQVRAGGKIHWDMDPIVEATSLERQLGTLGPQLYAESWKGNVVIRLKPRLRVPVDLASNQAAPAGGAHSRNPEPVPAIQTAKPAPVPAATVSTAPAMRPASSSVSAPGVPAPETRRDGVSERDKQQPEAQPGEYSLKVSVDSVILNVSVLDRSSNRGIAGLRREDFRVYEDGVLQQIEQFQPGQAPFNLMLLLDVSGSTQPYINLMQEAAIAFIRQVKDNDRIALATFNSSVQLIEGFTGDRAVAEAAIMRIWPGGGTAFYDALMTCIDQYMRGIEGRSAIVVFTDGVDNQLYGDRTMGSRTTFDQLYRRVQEIESLVYPIFLDTEGQYPGARGPGTTNTTGTVIDILGGVLGRGRYPGSYPDPRGYPNPGSYPPQSPYPSPSPYPTPNPYPAPSPYPAPNPYPTPNPSPSPYPSPGPNTYPRNSNERAAYVAARNQLMLIADQTGGRMYTARRIEELSRVYAQIADDLRIQYQLSYSSTNRARDGRWRAIRVVIDGHPEAVVRTRKGYYSRQ